MSVFSRFGLMVAVVATSMVVSSSSCKAQDAYIYNYADMEGWGVQYFLDARLNVLAVRAVNFGGDRYKPNPEDDDPTGPIGPWVKIADVERVYGGFSKFAGFKPSDDDDGPWGPLGPIIRGMDKQFRAMGAYNTAYSRPDPTGDICPWPFPWPCPWWELTDIWDFEVETDLGTLGRAAIFEASALDVLNQFGPEPQPWQGYESLAGEKTGGR